MNITKKKQTHSYRNKLVVTMVCGGGGEWTIQGWGVGGINYGQKICSKTYCTPQGIQPMFYNNYKWKVTFNIIYNIKKNF